MAYSSHGLWSLLRGAIDGIMTISGRAFPILPPGCFFHCPSAGSHFLPADLFIYISVWLRAHDPALFYFYFYFYFYFIFISFYLRACLRAGVHVRLPACPCALSSYSTRLQHLLKHLGNDMHASWSYCRTNRKFFNYSIDKFLFSGLR